MSSRYIKVENESNLVRDSVTNAILNTDISAVKKHQHRMQQLTKQTFRDREINNLKQEITELREMLLKLMNKE